MRLRVSERFAWVLRTLMLPLVLATKRFPRGARAPAEIRPDPVEVRGLTQDAAAQRLERVAEEVAAGLHRVAREGGSPRFTHAYFGVLTPFATLRLLAAHTRHHERGIGSAMPVRD